MYSVANDRSLSRLISVAVLERLWRPCTMRLRFDKGTSLMPNENELELNATATAQLIVGPEDLASSLPIETGDAFPQVLATARMVALMEIAASRVLKPLLGPGELSVGVIVDVTHSAPTPPGVQVTATARYAGREGKLFLFEVSASDPGGEIGRGWHKRAIVTSERLQGAAARRLA